MAALGFRSRPFAFGGVERRVFSKGEGRPILLMHELPGLDETNVDFAERLVQAGFQVHLPLLFGRPLQSALLGNFMRLRFCVSAGFARMAAGESGPVIDWLRALAADMADMAGDGRRRVGVIGMCVTGGLAIPLVVVPGVMAAVASQPAAPINFTYLLTGRDGDPAWRRQLNVSDGDIEAAAQCARRDDKRLLLQRFKADRACPHERVARVSAAFGEQAEVHEYARPGERWSSLRFAPHALLTQEYDDHGDHDVATRQALARVIDFFDRTL